MSKENPDVVVLWKNTEGLSSRSYADVLQEKLSDYSVVHADTPKQERELIKNAPVATGVTMDEHLLDHAEELEMFVVASSGYNHLPMTELTERGIVVSNASGIHAPGIAEQALGYMLAFERNIHRGIHQQRDREWDRYGGGELADRTVGILGLGAIGTRTAELCSALGLSVLGTKRDPTEKPDAADAVFDPSGLDVVLERADYLVVACPLTEETRGLIDAGALETMPDSSVLVNVARGEIVNEGALVDALEDGAIAGAALDVFEEEPLPEDSPLWDRRDVVLTPHVAGTTPHYWERAADILAENYRRLSDGEDLVNGVV